MKVRIQFGLSANCNAYKFSYKTLFWAPSPFDKTLQTRVPTTLSVSYILFIYFKRQNIFKGSVGEVVLSFIDFFTPLSFPLTDKRIEVFSVIHLI